MTKVKKLISWIVGTVVVLLIIVWVFMSRGTGNNGLLKIGFVGPLSGGPAVWGEGARNMTQLAVDEINASGGINGRMIAVDYQDGKCTSKDAVSATQKLMQEGIKVIVGGHCSPETAGMVPLSKDGSFFMIAGITAADNAVSGSDYAFRTSPPTIDFVKPLVSIVEQKYTKIVTITESAAFAKSFTGDFVKTFTDSGGQVLSQEGYDPSTTDFRSILLKVKAENPEAILISPQSPTTAALIAKQMQELDISVPVFGNSILVTNAVYNSSGKSLALISATGIIPYVDQTKQIAQTLIQKYKTKFGADIPYNFFYVSATYDAVYLLRDAIVSCHSDDVKCIAEYVKRVDYKGVSAEYTFKPNGDSNFASFAVITLDSSGQEIVTPITK